MPALQVAGDPGQAGLGNAREKRHGV
jgi:hypothetical protein